MKMLRSWHERVDDMVGALDEIAGFVAGVDYDGFRADRKTQMAVLADLFIVGETAARLMQDAATVQTTVPWKELRALREPLEHGRMVHDVKALWTMVIEELPAYAAALRAFASTPFEEELPSLD
jgi:uncharacterized protein with HEPN domain